MARLVTMSAGPLLVSAGRIEPFGAMVAVRTLDADGREIRRTRALARSVERTITTGALVLGASVAVGVAAGLGLARRR